jgi:hypothetical protein
MRSVHIIPKVLIGIAALTVTEAALAQATRSSVAVASSTGSPEFKDPKTGQIWTPETVGQDGRPLTGPDDKAFNPSTQNVPTTMIEQRVRGRPVGTVSVTAGPTVPIVVMNNATLRAAPGKRWQAVVYLDNNSGNKVEPFIECRFTNGGNPVMATRAMVQQTAPSVRQGLVIYGPRTDVFVDRVSCQVTAP